MPKFRGLGLKKFRADLARVGKLGLDLMKKMLKVCPNDRISCCEALRHPYFSALIANID
jgi:serine/threonine protein kinase